MSKTDKIRYWEGSMPSKCDICRRGIKQVFIDGKLRSGPWGILCPKCHSKCGVGLGLGKGQQYERQIDGRWLKVEG